MATNNGAATAANNLGPALLALALTNRLGLTGSGGPLGYGTKRDYYEALGYPAELDFATLYAAYKREGLSGRVIDLPPQDTWRRAFDLREGPAAGNEADAGGRDNTPFVRAFWDLNRRLKLVSNLGAVDRLSGIGRYGILLLGVAGDKGANLAEPLEAPAEVVYLRAYHEGRAEIEARVTDPADPRFGLPEVYKVTLEEDGTPVAVHASRVIHVAEDPLEDLALGRPRLERVYNYLLDLLKHAGGAAEANWRVMNQGLHANVVDGAALSTEDAEDLSDEIEAYIHGLQRFIRTQNIELNPLGGQALDPSGGFGVIVALIAAAADIPQRILIGSERGDLASTQDERNWYNTVADRQNNHAEPNILRPLLDRLIELQTLPAPAAGEYTVLWRSLYDPTPAETAEIADKVASAIAKIAPPGMPEAVMSPEEFRTRYLMLPGMPEGAEAAADNTEG